MKAKNTPIGEVVCSHKGCDQVCKVYRFRPRTEGRKSVFSGKHYAECPVHGRIGSDGNQASTDYILEHGKIWGANDAAPEPDPEKSAAAKKSAPAPKPAPAHSQRAPAPGSTPAPASTGTREQPAAKRRPFWLPLID